MSFALGLDFGTTNSAIAAAAQGSVKLAQFQSSAGPTETFRSIVYLDPEELGPDRCPLATTGPGAIEQYLAADGQGRLLQSLKSYLASRLFKSTQVCGRTYTLEVSSPAFCTRALGRILASYPDAWSSAARSASPGPATSSSSSPTLAVAPATSASRHSPLHSSSTKMTHDSAAPLSVLAPRLGTSKSLLVHCRGKVSTASRPPTSIHATCLLAAWTASARSECG